MNFSDVKRVTQDSREIRPGDYFVACRGEHVDGHEFISDALERGAAGVLEEDDLFELAKQKLAEFDPIVVGITGSVGKTTTKEAVAAVLAQKYKVLKSPGNVNVRRSLSIYVLNELTLAHDILVVEMAMDRFGEIGEICETVKPNIAVLTSISETHLEKLGTIERIKETKAEILDALNDKGVAVLNGDDAHVRDISSRAPGKVVWFGLGQRKGFTGTAFWAEDIKINFSGTSFRLIKSSNSQDNILREIELSVLGEGAVYASLAAAAMWAALDLNFFQIKNGLTKLEQVPQRMNLVKSKRGFWVLDDSYNASDVSTISALDTLERLPGRKIAVLGDMLELGKYEKAAHEGVGKKAAEVADMIIAVGNLGKLIGKSARKAGLSPVYFANDNSEAVEILESDIGLEQNDIILVKASRGAKMEEIVAHLCS